MPGREPAANQSGSIRGIAKRPLFPLGFVVVLAATVYAGVQLYQKQVIAPWNEMLEEKTQATSRVLVSQLEDQLAEIGARLAETTENPELITALNNNQSQRLEATKSRLLNAWPELHELIIVDRDFDEKTLGENFIAINLLRQTNAGEQPAPVARKIGDAWYMQLSRAVVGKPGNIVGSVLLSLPMEVVTETIAAQQSGQVEIQQFSQHFAPQTLWSSGSGSSDLKQSLPMPSNPAWRLRYSAPESLRRDMAKPLNPFLASVAGLVLVAGLLLWLLFIAARQTWRKLAGSTPVPDDLTPEDDIHTFVLNRAVHEKPAHKEAGQEEVVQEETIPEEPIQEKPAPAPVTEDQHNEATNTDGTEASGKYPSSVFRDYDIRGQADNQITKGFALALGKTLGTRALETSQTTLAVAMDGRVSSPGLSEALIEGILATGCDILDLGLIPTPAFNFALQTLDEVSSGIMVTASHNPPGDNGFKLVFEQNVMSAEQIAELAIDMSQSNWAQGEGKQFLGSTEDAYVEAICKDVSISNNLHIVVDCGNGAMGAIAPKTLEALGCEVTPLYCDIDGEFPNHAPDPSDPRNLKDLISIIKLQQADLGLAFDGDGDRLVAVTAKGRIVWPDELMMIFSRDILSRQPGASVVFDVKSTRRLPDLISAYGGKPIECKTGHSNVRRKIQQTGAILGGEYSGHIFFNERWFGFDDGLYAAARLTEILDAREQSLDEIMDGFERSVATPEIKLEVKDIDKFHLMEKIAAEAVFDNGAINNLDGLRVSFDKGWGLIRASNTSACLTLRFEADDQEALVGIQDCFKTQISRIVPDLALPF